MGLFYYMNHLNLSNSGLEHILKWEGERLRAYKDVAGHLTIGAGHLITKIELRSGMIEIDGDMVNWRNGITSNQSKLLLRQDARIAVNAVNRFVKVPLSQHQFDALVSFVFNIGVTQFNESTLLKKLNQGQYDAVPSELAKWRKAGGKVVKGLVNRRASEARLWRSAQIKKPLQSRTNKGAAVAASGQLINLVYEAQEIKAGADNITSGLGEYAQWIAISLTIIGVLYIVYARYDDRRNGIR